MAAQEWAELDPTRPSDDQLVQYDDESLVMLAREVTSYTDGERHRCVRCFTKARLMAVAAFVARRVPAGFIQHSLQEWRREFGRWREVRGVEAYQRPLAYRACEVCEEELA